MLSINEIKKIIPQRSPFLLIDRIDELIPGVRAVGRKCVSYNELFFTGHFPEEPVMPGVLVIEALAQVGAVLCLSLDENKGKNSYFGGINKARFRNKIFPGDVLTLEVELIKKKGNVGVAAAKAYDENKVFAEAELTFVIG
ncbi:3-hydroxyacyl-[acyl-carrier-protein] dehydratase FabZ [Anaerocolumna cellulosilytica]|uniref:3-hydroxyacyl-[acyl-carrier-protein] dehydratase n=1 Tax=Anaerocolumna cellulosilytica TaxID=433286 RepID=A0A6S6RA14_9FIRM|nr:3-hydroxyacyl-ACP dehydratase FabZ [Anaerocolumna cellulosilytica]MBB5195051.1 3-hydroxyacyl-[acyl-carrier-protein] dehydratase [Anaerocolumna cellulosilytica]BCJ96112.1 3-hydroxyacyl-[acyl-carrier-protein] dehydratase FabZ [Anaerocolumna cellulosilytica]